MLATTDPDIRTALYNKKLKPYRTEPNTIVVDELGLAHARVRIDIAVINGCVHGYEIKSSSDTLERLSSQLDIYRRCLGKLTLVCATKHIDQVIKSVPVWCGILEATRGLRGAVNFTVLRRAYPNPDIDPVLLAHLLWRPEAIALLARLGASPKNLRQPRKLLYTQLAEVMTVEQLTTSIREFMLRRPTWRYPPAHA